MHHMKMGMLKRVGQKRGYLGERSKHISWKGFIALDKYTLEVKTVKLNILESSHLNSLY